MIPFNFSIALRHIWKNKIFSGVNIIGLSVSMASCALVSLYVWTELRYDSFHEKLQSIYRITEKQDQGGTLYNVAVTPGLLAASLQKDFPEILSTVRFGNWSGTLKNTTHTYEEKNIQFTDNSIFSTFSFPLLKGNAGTALSQPNEIVITAALAAKYFGKDWQNNPALLGQVFTLSGQGDFKLAGVAKDIPDNSSIRFDVLLPLSFLFSTDPWSNKWNSNNFHTYLQLRPGTDAAGFAKKIEHQLHRYNPAANDVLQLQALKDQYLYSSFDFKTDWGKRSNIKYIKIFAGVGCLLLIIACANFINLSMAASVRRTREVGIRKVNGATRRQLVLQLLSESLLVALIAGLLALVLIRTVGPLLQLFTGSGFTTVTLLPFMLAFVIVTGLLAGLYPALVMSAWRPASILKKSIGDHSGKLFRQGLVVTQFFISVTLMICTSFMYRQLHFMQQKDLGFDQTQLISIRMGGLSQKTEPFQHELMNLSGVQATAPATMTMVNVDNSSYLEWEGMQKDDKFLVTQANINPSFIPVLGMQLLNGNNFSLQKTNDTANYIVNETAVKRMGYTIANAIGRQLVFWGAKGHIIGIVKDFHFKPLTTAIEPFIFRYQPQDRYFNLFVKVVPGKAQDVIERISKLYKQYEAELPFEYHFVSDTLNASYQEERRTANIILLFANLTIFVGCLGLFGLTVFSAALRTKEIGVRKVLGAGITSIARLLTGDFIKLVLIAIVAALPMAWFITGRWLQGYAYRIDREWWIFALVGVAVIAMTVLTVSFQTYKAAAANPVRSLRTE